MNLTGGLFIQSEIVAIRKGDPLKVVIKDEIHYFIWLWDLYRPFDYEPVKIVNLNSKNYVFTRYHWNGTVLWTDPIQKNGLPILDFYIGVHTPLILSRKGNITLSANLTELTPLELKLLFHLYLPLLTDMLAGRISLNIDKTKGYNEKIVTEAIPPKYEFSPHNYKFLILVGINSIITDLPDEIKLILQKNVRCDSLS